MVWTSMDDIVDLHFSQCDVDFKFWLCTHTSPCRIHKKLDADYVLVNYGIYQYNLKSSGKFRTCKKLDNLRGNLDNSEHPVSLKLIEILAVRGETLHSLSPGNLHGSCHRTKNWQSASVFPNPTSVSFISCIWTYSDDSRRQVCFPVQ